MAMTLGDVGWNQHDKALAFAKERFADKALTGELLSTLIMGVADSKGFLKLLEDVGIEANAPGPEGM